MSLRSQLSWENFRTTVLLPNQQRVHRISMSPQIEVFGDGVQNRIGIWVEVPNGTPVPAELSRLASLASRIVTQHDCELLEIVTTTSALQRQFYHFALAVAERVIVDKRPTAEAVSLELRS